MVPLIHQLALPEATVKLQNFLIPFLWFSYNGLFDGGTADTNIQQARLNLSNLSFEERRIRIFVEATARNAFSEYDGKVSAVSSKMLVLEGARIATILQRALLLQ